MISQFVIMFQNEEEADKIIVPIHFLLAVTIKYKIDIIFKLLKIERIITF